MSDEIIRGGQSHLSGNTQWPTPFPAEFDEAIYLGHPANSDLRILRAGEAKPHYRRYGQGAGRICSEIASRDRFLSLVPRNAALLEIGPFCTPCFRRDTHDVRYLDVRTTEELREWARTLSWAVPDKVPDIDYVWQGEPYRTLTSDRFTALFSSHNIEHQPCLVTHLNEAASLLRSGGKFFLNIPDKRYCFDHFRPETTIADVLDAYLASPTRHVPRSVLGNRLLMTHNDKVAHWRGEHGDDPRGRTINAAYLRTVRETLGILQRNSEYIDCHAWQFTPDSFRHLMGILYAAELIPFQIERLYPTLRNTNEFYAILCLDARLPSYAGSV